MIKQLIIDNFRSIEHEEINFGQLNAFIGSNNAGNSNIMDALNLLLGATFPSVRSFDNKDFYDYDPTHKIIIQVNFDASLACNSKVCGFKLTYDGRECDYFSVDGAGDIVLYPSKKEVRVSADMRDEVTLMYLGLDRQASQQIRATSWTLYGKLLKFIEKRIDDSKKTNFKDGLNTSYKTHIYPDIQPMEDILKKHVKDHMGVDLQLRLSIMDPIETINNLRPYLKETNTTKEFDAVNMGAGTQSALAVAIAQAYGEIVKKPLVIVIEEPELYLHPHGCRHFYKLLKNLAETGVQVIFTTHERCFVDISNFNSIHLVRKESNTTKVYSGMGKTISAYAEIKRASKFDESINEVFFAHNVILVESTPDKIACQLALENLGLELDRDSISVTECGGNTGIKPIGEVLKIFKVPVIALVDEDPGNPSTAKTITELQTTLGKENVFLASPHLEGLFGLPKKPSKADALILFPEWFSKNSPPAVFQEIKKQISNNP
jgi:putative ATP-dependent endonuclease of OLD family